MLQKGLTVHTDFQPSDLVTVNDEMAYFVLKIYVLDDFNLVC